MDWQNIWNLTGGAALCALGWAARTMYDSIRELQRELAAHKVEVARDYATNVDIKDINTKLDDILRYLRK